MWDYAKLSQLAKAVGGPEALYAMLIKKGFVIGMKQARHKYGVFIAAGSMLSAVIGGGVVYLYMKRTQKKKAKKGAKTEEKDLATDKETFVQSIVTYDREAAKRGEKPLPDISAEEAEKEIEEEVKSILKHTDDREE